MTVRDESRYVCIDVVEALIAAGLANTDLLAREDGRPEGWGAGWYCALDGLRENLHSVSRPAAATFDLRAFSAENLERCTSAAGFGHPLELWSLSDWMTAALGELGEAANVVKKLNRYRDGITGNVKTEAELRQDLADELADAFIYLDLLAQAAAVDLPKAIREKFDRTSAKIGYVAGGEVRS